MRAGAAQPCQVRKEATVSGGLLRRDHPGKGAFFPIEAQHKLKHFPFLIINNYQNVYLA